MDKQQLLGYFQDHYLSRQDVLFKLPLNISIDSFWQDLVNQRKARATMLPLYSATGQPYWFVTTDKMVKASERLCEEAMRHDSFFDPYRIPLSQALTSALSQEAYFTSFVEGADYPIQAAVEFLRRGSEPENAYEQNILNNYQAGSYLLSALSMPFDESFVKELAATLADGQDGYRTTDVPAIPAMEGEAFTIPPAHLLADRMNQFYVFLADVRVHPLIKSAVGQAYILTTRPFQEANERLGRLISNAVLLRYGYDFFLNISISAYIARESFRYFKAMREVIRSDNEGDLTYFVEYFLELLVRALDGTRMEEAERLQSQLESERKMALQPLKQPTVQYTQPHSYSAEAIARVIDNADSRQDSEEEAYDENGTERKPAVIETVDAAAPDPPELLSDNASIHFSQLQAGLAQCDKKPGGEEIATTPQMIAEECQTDTGPQEVSTPLPPGDAGPRIPAENGSRQRDNVHQTISDGAVRLFGLTADRRERIGKMLRTGLSPFYAAQWAEGNGVPHKAACMECRELYLTGLADRTLLNGVYSYNFRFSSKDYAMACAKIDKADYRTSPTFENWRMMLSLMEQSGIDVSVKAAAFIRYCQANGITRFYAAELGSWGSLQKTDVLTAARILEERGIVRKPVGHIGKLIINLPPPKGQTGTVAAPERELLQAVVASPDDAPIPAPVQISQAMEDKLAELLRSDNSIDKRIGKVISEFLRIGKLQFIYTDWLAITGLSKSVVNTDMTKAVDLGLVKKLKPMYCHGPIVHEVVTNPVSSARWSDLTANTCQILEGIIRYFGEKEFTIQEAAVALDVSSDILPYYIKMLKTRSILSLQRRGQHTYKYRLIIPMEEAIQQLRNKGFTQIALVG